MANSRIASSPTEVGAVILTVPSGGSTDKCIFFMSFLITLISIPRCSYLSILHLFFYNFKDYLNLAVILQQRMNTAQKYLLFGFISKPFIRFDSLSLALLMALS